MAEAVALASPWPELEAQPVEDRALAAMEAQDRLNAVEPNDDVQALLLAVTSEVAAMESALDDLRQAAQAAESADREERERLRLEELARVEAVHNAHALADAVRPL